MKKFLFASAALIAMGVGVPAIAADMPVKAVYKTPVVTVYSWTGCYVGGNVGGLWVNKQWYLQTDGSGRDLGGHDANSFLGGLQAGCNYQFAGGWVIGIQGDYGWSNAKGSHIDRVNATITDSSQIRSLASVTGRIGYAWDRFLGYVKGGGAWERDNYYGTVTATGAPFDSASETRSGWTFGIGGEYAFTHFLTAFIEYDYYAFGTRRLTFLTPAGAFSDYIDIRERKNVVKLGLNFKFGGYDAVVAKY